MSEASRKWSEVKIFEEKVTVAIYDPADLKVREMGKFPIAKNGHQIRIKSGGEGHFMPTFDTDSFLQFPKKRLGGLLGTTYEKTYIVPKMGTSCVNFKIPKVDEIDILKIKRDIEEAAGNKILRNIGSDEKETPMLQYIQTFLLLAIIWILVSVLGLV